MKELTFFRKQVSDAYALKGQTGADYSDLSDRLNDYARKERELRGPIAHLREITAALAGLERPNWRLAYPHLIHRPIQTALVLAQNSDRLTHL